MVDVVNCTEKVDDATADEDGTTAEERMADEDGTTTADEDWRVLQDLRRYKRRGLYVQ
jgi:hypothetical protein